MDSIIGLLRNKLTAIASEAIIYRSPNRSWYSRTLGTKEIVSAYTIFREL